MRNPFLSKTKRNLELVSCSFHRVCITAKEIVGRHGGQTKLEQNAVLSEHGREVIEEEMEAVFSGKKEAKTALDDAVRRGNEILRKFEAANKGS